MDFLEQPCHIVANRRFAFSLRAITKNARKATRVTVRDHTDLEEWVDDEGRLVLIGEAAHPFPVRLPFLTLTF